MRDTLKQLSRVGMFAILVVGLFRNTPCQAQRWSEIIRKVAKVAKNVPVNKADDFASSLAGNKSFNESVVRRFRKTTVPTGTAISRRLDGLIKNLDPGSVKAIRELDDSGKSVAVVLLEGAGKTGELIPDLAMRGRFIKNGGPETIAAIGLHGDAAARQLRIFDGQLSAGNIIGADGNRAAGLQDLGRFLSNGGDNAWKFWQERVMPHWGKWLAGGAISAFLIDPDSFIDRAGNLTEYGSQKLFELGGATLAGAVKGVAAGSKAAGNEVIHVFWQEYLASWNAVYAWCGLGFVVAILVPKIRSRIIGSLNKHLGSDKND